MDAIKLLDRQHDDLDEIFDQFVNADDDAERRRCFHQIADQLAIHTTLEERHFYPAVRSADTEALVAESFDEHANLKRMLIALLDRREIDADFITLVEELKGEVEYHVDEERAELFPKVRRMLDTAELDALGDQMAATMSELLEEPSLRSLVTAPAGPT